MDSLIFKSFFLEIFLSFCILLHLISNSVVVNNLKNNFPLLLKENFSQVSFILWSSLFLINNNKIEGFFYNFLFLSDISTNVVKFSLLFLLLLSFFGIFRGYLLQNLNFFEYFSIFLISVFSSTLMINVADMLTFYLLIELQALVFYVLASFKRDSSFSVEAGLKYFIIGSFISGIFLFGCSLIYFSIGTLNFNNISVLLYTQFPLEFIVEYQLLLLGVLLVTFVFLFKVLAAPFHFWSPDVYEGAPLSTTIIFSILPKLSIFYIFVKWMSIVIIFEEIRLILLFSGFLSILLGSFWAFKQKRLKRLIIYSSLAQLGFLISVLSSYSVNAYASLYFFLFVYLITSILIWNYYSLLATFQKEINNFFENSFKPLYVTVFTSFFKVNTTWAFSFLIIFFSLAGIPPFVGFLSKFFVLVSLLEFGNFFSSFSLLMISSISVFYYLRIVKIVYFENIPNFKIELSQIIFSDYYYFSNCFLLAILLYLLLFFSFFPSFLLLISKLIVLGSYFF